MELDDELDDLEPDEMFPLLVASVSLFSKVRDSFVTLIETGSDIDYVYAMFAGSQMKFFSSRVQSLTLLVQDWKLWDADILMRSAIESATSFLYVSTRDPTSRGEAIRELHEYLPEVHRIERSEKAKGAARNAVDPEDALIFRGAALSSEEEAELRARWPKARRKALKQKWSFSELVPELERVREPSLNLSAYGSLLYSYALGSHFVHADRTAIALVQDRAGRGREERVLLERAHYARIAIEPTVLFYLCFRGMAHALGIEVDMRDLGRGVVALYSLGEPYHRDFSASQAEFYASMGVT